MAKNLKSIPKEWPSAFGAYKYSSSAMAFCWAPVLSLMLLLLALSISTDRLHRVYTSLTGGILIEVMSGVLSSLLSVAILLVILSATKTKREKVSFLDSIDLAVPFLVKYIAQSIIIAAILILSLAALIIPFFFIAPRLALANYFLIDKDMGPIEAIKASWSATEGNVGKVYGILGVMLLMLLPALTIVGLPFTLYFVFMYLAAPVILYRHIQSQPAKA